MFEKALSLISRYDRIIIHRHNNPDGDAIGSQVGLKHLILENFKGKEVYNTRRILPRRARDNTRYLGKIAHLR